MQWLKKGSYLNSQFTKKAHSLIASLLLLLLISGGEDVAVEEEGDKNLELEDQDEEDEMMENISDAEPTN